MKKHESDYGSDLDSSDDEKPEPKSTVNKIQAKPKKIKDDYGSDLDSSEDE